MARKLQNKLNTEDRGAGDYRGYVSPFARIYLYETVETIKDIDNLLKKISDGTVSAGRTKSENSSKKGSPSLDINNYISSITVSKEAEATTRYEVVLTPPYDDAIALMRDTDIIFPGKFVHIVLGYTDAVGGATTQQADFYGVLGIFETSFAETITITLPIYSTIALDMLRTSKTSKYTCATIPDKGIPATTNSKRRNVIYDTPFNIVKTIIEARGFVAESPKPSKEMERFLQVERINIPNVNIGGITGAAASRLGTPTYASKKQLDDLRWVQGPHQSLYAYLIKICYDCGVMMNDGIVRGNKNVIEFLPLTPEADSDVDPVWTFKWRSDLVRSSGSGAQRITIKDSTIVPIIAMESVNMAPILLYGAAADMMVKSVSSDTGMISQIRQLATNTSDGLYGQGTSSAADGPNSGATLRGDKQPDDVGSQTGTAGFNVSQIIGTAAAIMATISQPFVNVVLPGVPTLGLGHYVDIAGTEIEFLDKRYLVVKVKHTYSTDGFRTSAMLLSFELKTKVARKLKGNTKGKEPTPINGET